MLTRNQVWFVDLACKCIQCEYYSSIKSLSSHVVCNVPESCKAYRVGSQLGRGKAMAFVSNIDNVYGPVLDRDIVTMNNHCILTSCSFVCCLVHRGSTEDLPLLQIPSVVVWQSRDLQLSRSTMYMYLLSPHLQNAFLWLSSTINSGSLKIIYYSKRYSLAHPLSFKCFHCS